MYSLGRKSRRVIEESREKIADILNVKKNEIYFTSCGSESDNLAIKGIAYANKNRGNHIITSKIEHPAVINTCKTLERQGYRVSYINVDNNGVINLEELEKAICHDTILITIMFANNEIGTIEPIDEINKLAKKHNIIFHTDAVQVVGNLRIDLEKLGVDLLSMSAHKFYGPKGIGALYVKEGIEFERVQDGGHQEKNKRAGTENVAGIVGIAKALELSMTNIENRKEHIERLRDFYISEVKKRIPNVKVNGNNNCTLPGIANISFDGVIGEDIVLNLDMKGICASSGSACTSGQNTTSHVLSAIGLDESLINGALRISIGEENTIDEIKILVDSLEEIVKRLRKNIIK